MKSRPTIEINKISESTKKSFHVRTITALVLLVVCIPCVILGDWFYIGAMIAISLASAYEFIRVLSSKKFPLFISIFTFIMTIIMIYWSWGKQFFGVGDPIINASGHFMTSEIGISTLALGTLILVLTLFALMYERFDITDVCYLTTMSLIVSLGIQSLLFLRFVPISSLANHFEYASPYITWFLLMYVVIGAFSSDIGAYAFGILFGKHKMNPRISPKKTWEGFFGGVLVSFICSFLFGFLLSYFGFPLLNTVLDIDHWYLILIVSLIMPFVSVLGDLLFSAIKRHYDFKDFSNLLPGHGGVLDRIDSLLITALTVTLLILGFCFVRGLII